MYPSLPSSAIDPSELYEKHRKLKFPSTGCAAHSASAVTLPSTSAGNDACTLHSSLPTVWAPPNGAIPSASYLAEPWHPTIISSSPAHVTDVHLPSSVLLVVVTTKEDFLYIVFG